MLGNNTLILNGATLKEAIQAWMNVQLSERCEIVGIRPKGRKGDEGYEVSFKRVEADPE